MSTTANALMGMPMGVIAAAFTKVTGLPPHNSKTGMVNTLARAVDNGSATLADIRRMGQATQARPAATLSATVGQPVPAFPAAAAAPSVGAAMLARVDSLENSLNRTVTDLQGLDARFANLGQVQSSMHARLGQLGTDLGSLGFQVSAAAQSAAAEAKSLRAQVQALAESVGQITLPAADIQAAMRQAVTDAWAPIRAAAEANGTESEVLAQVQAGPTGQASALDVFGVDVRDQKGRALMFTTYGHPEAPAVDPCFIWTEAIIKHLHIAQQHGRNVWMGGPAGTGKTQTAQQFAARTGRMFRRFVFDRFSTRDDFLGATGLDNGSTTFEPGPVLEAYTTPGAVCLLDEVGMGQPAALSALNAFLERGAQVAYADRVWHRGAGTMFLAADNSLTQGDQSGRFAGVQPMNVAFADRFSLVVPFQYLDPVTEAEALCKHTGCTLALADHLVHALGTIRAKVQTGDIIDPPSIRQMIAFIEALQVLEPAEAWRSAIAARQPAESEAALAAIFATCIDTQLISREV
jgi:MoxR-like ATPase